MRPQIEDIRSLGDFATLYNWNLAFIQGAIVSPDINNTNYRCVSADMPKKAGQTITQTIRGHAKKQAGIYTYDPITLTFVETADNFITSFLNQWHEACWQTNTGIQEIQSNVECTVRLERLDRQGNPIWFYELVGCFLESYDPGGQLADQGDTLKPTITLQYDYFKEGAM